MSLVDLQPALAAQPKTRTAAPPASVIPVSDGLAGLLALTMAWLLVLLVRPPLIVGAWAVLLATALPMLRAELRRCPAVSKVRETIAPLIWIAGFIAAAAPLFFVHAQAGRAPFWLNAWAIVAPAFAIRLGLEARRTGSIALGFPAALGRALFPFDPEKLKALGAPARLWALKAFYIPLYAASLYALVRIALGIELSGWVGWLTLLVIFAYTIDLAFALAGYIFASNDLIPTLRSTQTRVLGWVACLACYGPIYAHWPQFGQVVTTEISWPRGMESDPTLLLAAAAMLVLLLLYVSATVVFGLRFCNLANRGLIAHGPYRLMKHPAYVAHVANAWIIVFVFLPAAGIALTPMLLLVPIAFTVFYSLRAITEEQHMREDPAYVAYEAWIAEHGLLARTLRLFGARPVSRESVR